MTTPTKRPQPNNGRNHKNKNTRAKPMSKCTHQTPTRVEPSDKHSFDPPAGWTDLLSALGSCCLRREMNLSVPGDYDVVIFNHNHFLVQLSHGTYSVDFHTSTNPSIPIFRACLQFTCCNVSSVLTWRISFNELEKLLEWRREARKAQPPGLCADTFGLILSYAEPVCGK